MAIEKLGDLFRLFPDLLVWMVMLDSDGIKARVKRVGFMIDSTPSAGFSDATRQILELHGFGLGLLMTEYARFSTDSDELSVEWLPEQRISDDSIIKWDATLYRIVSGLRYAVLSQI